MSRIIPHCVEKFVKPVLEYKPSMVVKFVKQVDIYVDKYWNDYSYESVVWAIIVEQKAEEDNQNSKEQLEKWARNKDLNSDLR